MFIHLRAHSYYSFLTGIPSPAQLVQATAENGMPALALTERDGLTGAVEFFEACHAAGVQPVLGLEISVSAPSGLSTDRIDNEFNSRGSIGSLALLAMDMQGWGSLCRLSSSLLTEPENIERKWLSFERLAGDSAGLICLTGGHSGLLSCLIRKNCEEIAKHLLHSLEQLFPGRLYVEVQRQSHGDIPGSNQLLTFVKRMNLPVVATHAIYYLKPEQAELQRLLTAIRLNCRLQNIPPQALAPPNSNFTSIEEMNTLFQDIPEASNTTLEIAERCHLELPLGKHHFPEVSLSDKTTAIQMLREKAFQGAQRLYGKVDEDIRRRLEHELSVIEERGYSPLFLIMQDILNYARQADIPTASRGSASSSLVAHCLDITTPDPIHLNLYFERFLNPARTTPPDIDTDLCSRRRDEVIRYVYETYGNEHVAMVGTINRFRSRSALREVAKARGLPPEEIKAMAGAIPHREWNPTAAGRAGRESPYQDLMERYQTPTHQAIFRDATTLRQIPDHLSIHPGGVVISPGPLTNLAPTQLSSKGIIITQFDLDSIERLGLVKIDLLGIRGLSVLGDVADNIRKKTPSLRISRLAILDSIPQEDPKTAQLIRNGRTIGCFQIESPGMRTTLKEIQADTVDDVLVALALYRPGPLGGGLKDAFVRRHLGQEPVTQLHPTLEQLLADTHGVILYQEQVLRIAHELAGLSLAEADLLRHAMSHFDPGKQMQSLKEKFIAGVMEHQDMPFETAEQVWDLMAAFAGYGFPKAHAASYAQIAWRSAWCKAHHPAEFMAAVLANWGGYYSQRVYMTEARRLGLILHPPHVNFSQREFDLQYQNGKSILFMGLDQVRDLTRRTQRRILQERPFHSLDDFLARADPKPQEAQNLVQVGAMQGMGSIPALLRILKSSRRQKGQLALFDISDEQAVLPGSEEDWDTSRKAAHQEAILGISVDFHPLELVAKQLVGQNVLSTVEAAPRIGQRIRVAGTRQTWRRAVTTHGDIIYFMALEDLEGVLNILIPGEVYRRCRTALSSQEPLVVEGTVEIKPGASEATLRAEKAWRVE